MQGGFDETSVVRRIPGRCGAADRSAAPSGSEWRGAATALPVRASVALWHSAPGADQWWSLARARAPAVERDSDHACPGCRRALHVVSDSFIPSQFSLLAGEGRGAFLRGSGGGADPARPAVTAPKAGDLLYVDREASVQFIRPILFRVIRVLDWITYEHFVWLDGYQLDGRGDAVARRTIFVQRSGLKLQRQGTAPPAGAVRKGTAQRPNASREQRSATRNGAAGDKVARPGGR